MENQGLTPSCQTTDLALDEAFLRIVPDRSLPQFVVVRLLSDHHQLVHSELVRRWGYNGTEDGRELLQFALSRSGLPLVDFQAFVIEIGGLPDDL